jgi:aldose 1-epimerase
MHGFVRWAAWTASVREPHWAVMERVLHPQPDYPFPLALRIEYAAPTRAERPSSDMRSAGRS